MNGRRVCVDLGMKSASIFFVERYLCKVNILAVYILEWMNFINIFCSVSFHRRTKLKESGCFTGIGNIKWGKRYAIQKGQKTRKKWTFSELLQTVTDRCPTTFPQTPSLSGNQSQDDVQRGMEVATLCSRPSHPAKRLAQSPCYPLTQEAWNLLHEQKVNRVVNSIICSISSFHSTSAANRRLWSDKRWTRVQSCLSCGGQNVHVVTSLQS